jgi:hypothetical protein
MFFKKSQITIFIVLGIIILILIGSFFLLINNSKNKIPSDFDVNFFNQYVQECVNQVSLDGLKILGLKGGYINIPKAINFQGNSLWYIDQVNVQPSLNQSLVRFKKYVDDNLINCVDFDDLERNYNININYKKPNSTVFFSRKGVFVDIIFPINVVNQDNIINFDYFSVSYELGFREMFEVATLLIDNQIKQDFNITEPLNELDTLGYNVDYIMPKEDIIIYTIKDRKQQKDGTYFTFIISSIFGESNLIRTIKLHDNSATTGIIFPQILYSIDRMAQLYLIQDTIISLNGDDVENISVRQYNLDKAIRENIVKELVIYNNGDRNIINGTKEWKLKYPVYSFNPTGLELNQGLPLLLYYDEEKIPRKGEMGIIYNNGSGWFPITSNVDYEKNVVYTIIPGFSNYTLVDCGELENDYAKVTGEIKFTDMEKFECYLGLGGVSLADPMSNIMVYFGVDELSLYKPLSYERAPFGFGTYSRNILGYTAQQDSITFISTCKQTISIKVSKDDAKGNCCIYVNGQEKCSGSDFSYATEAGDLILMKSKLERCDGMDRYTCGNCKINCEASFK